MTEHTGAGDGADRERARATSSFPMLSVADLDASLRFYGDMLGGHVAYRYPDDGPPEFVTLRIGDSELGLGRLTDQPTLHGRQLRPAAGHRIELCVYVTDIDTITDALAGTGATIVLAPSDQPWGERIAYVEDPDGNLVMLAAPPQDPAPSGTGPITTDAAGADPECEVAHGERAEPATDTRELVVVYASALGAYLLSWGRELGFSTTLLEPDPAAVTRGHRSAADTVLHDPAGVSIGPSTDVVVSDHHRDDLGAVMAPLVVAAPRWIGIIGSPRHAGPHVQALAAQGLDETTIARVRRPIGLDIGSKRPAEIALSVLAGLVADRNGRTGGPFVASAVTAR